MGGPLGSPTEPGGEAEDSQELLNPWTFYVWRVKAAAAGIDRERFSRMTLSEVQLHIEGQRWNHAMTAMAQIDYHLSKISDKDLDEAEQNHKSPHPRRDELRRAMLAKVAPAFLLAELFGSGSSSTSRSRPIPGMRPEAAKGIMDAFNERLLSDAAWYSVVHYYERLEATAR